MGSESEAIWGQEQRRKFEKVIGRLPRQAIKSFWESKFWVDKNEHGWIADIDTTFALYPPNSPFTYKAIRLDKPYCIKHIPWYLDQIPEEWKYYLEHASSVSSWGSKLKKQL